MSSKSPIGDAGRRIGSRYLLLFFALAAIAAGSGIFFLQPSFQSEDDEEKAKEIALADPRVQDAVDGKNYRVLNITPIVSPKTSVDYIIGIYVYGDAQWIKVPVDMATGEVQDVFIQDNSSGGIPTKGEGLDAYLLVSENNLREEIIADKKYTYHIHKYSHTDPLNPCSESRCLLVSTDLVLSENDSLKQVQGYDPNFPESFNHYTYSIIDMNSDDTVSMTIPQPALGISVPQDSLVGVELRYYEADGLEKYSLDDVRAALNAFFANRAVSSVHEGKSFYLKMSGSDLSDTVEISTWMPFDNGIIADYATAQVVISASGIDGAESVIIGEPRISKITQEEAREAAKLVLQSELIEEINTKAGSWMLKVQDVEGDENKVDVVIEAGKSVGGSARVDLTSHAIISSSELGE